MEEADNRGARLDMCASDTTSGSRATLSGISENAALRTHTNPSAVHSQSKRPVARQWERGEADEKVLAVHPSGLNTGILAAGLRCFDVDVDDPHVVDLIENRIRQRYPNAIVRRRANSPRSWS